MSAIFAWSRSFLRSDRGSAAVEAAFIFPVFLALFPPSLVSFDAYMASQGTIRAATTTVDLATRVTSIDNAMRDSIFAAAQAVTGSYIDSLEDFTVVIASIAFSEGDDGTDGEFTLEWSISNEAGMELTDADIVGLELPELADGETVIFASVTAQYVPYLELPLFQGKEFSVRQIRLPRFSVRVEDNTI